MEESPLETGTFYAEGKPYLREYHFSLRIEDAEELEKKKFFQKLKKFLEKKSKLED